MLTGREHVERYLATDGEEGHDWNGMPILILTTTGRRSGAKHTTALAYQPYGGSLLVVASKRGAVTPPDWYLNLVSDPRVEVQVKADRYHAEARTATQEQRPDMWRTMTNMYPGYDDFQARIERQIPVVILTRVAQ